MLGGIYTEEKCPLCGQQMKDNHRDSVCCPNPKHRNQKANNLIVRFGRKFYKRTTDYDLACRILTGIRFKFDEGSYDPRDYQQTNPLGLETQIEKYLEIKSKTLREGTMKSVRPHVTRISKYFGPLNVKNIAYAEIEDFILAQNDIGDKTKHNLLSTLHDFFTWLVKRKILRKDQFPEFPQVKFQLSDRKTVTKDTQISILEEIKRQTWDKNPRIYIGCLWCATYINIRPGELYDLLEEDVDYERGLVFIRRHKTDRSTSVPKQKVIPLFDEDLEMIKALSRGFPHMHFFRRDRSGGGKHANTAFGRNRFYRAWIAACQVLGIDGVDMYGGTRHSSAIALRKMLSPEGIRRLTDHETNKAFERYYMKDLDELRDGYALTRKCNTGATPISQSRKAKKPHGN